MRWCVGGNVENYVTFGGFAIPAIEENAAFITVDMWRARCNISEAEWNAADERDTATSDDATTATRDDATVCKFFTLFNLDFIYIITILLLF